MKREMALTKLRALESELRVRGVQRLFLFGSVANDSALDTSDVDLFFEDDPDRPLGVFAVMGVEQFISDKLGVEVDLIPKDSLHVLLKDDIVASAQAVY